MASLGLVFRNPHLLFRKAGKQDRRSAEELDGTTPRLCTFPELPKWYQDNPHIQTGYRPVSNSYQSCLLSLSYLHNETINIYTHFLPALILALVLPTLQIQISRIYHDTTWIDRFMLTLSPMAALFTLTLSTTYHTLMNHSAFISGSCLLLDYTGILALILASFISGIYVGFYNHPFYQKFYWTMITALITLSCLLVLHPRLQGPRYRPHRTTAFILTALSGFAPVINGVVLYGWYDAYYYRGVKWWLAEGLWYGIGVAFFATRWPERRGSGRFDVVGSSHQFFHVCVVLGAVCHCWGVWGAWRANT